jgi:bifunctional UDP-N-acetylglucosamine pyrophosphorylase/glucosamine-1-phosphate N-acetyltransferase
MELKNAKVGTASKMNHLSYLGDVTIGADTNIGAGVITCNYDGTHKHQTRIGEHVFIGSNTQLIAPVVIGDHVTIGAGTTVTKDVAAHALIHNRLEHRYVENWKEK